MESHASESMMEIFCGRAGKYYNKNKVPLLSTMIIGLLSYMYAFTNKLPNWDDVVFMFSKGATISSGRWALPILSLVFPDFSMPWIYGIISLAIMGAANAVLIQELQIKKKIDQILFCGLVIVFPAFIGTVPFMFTLSSYSVAFFLASVAVFCANSDNSWIRILGILLSVVSMGIYQAYLAVTSSFFLICLIRLLMVEGKSAEQVAKKGCYYLFHLGITCAVYLLITYLIQQLTETGYSTYAQDRMDFAGILSPQRLKRAYTVFITELLYGEYGFLSTPWARLSHTIAFAGTGFAIIKWSANNKNIAQCVLLVVILLLLPLSISCFVLVVTNDMIQSMLFFSFVAIYGLVCMVIDQCVDTVYGKKIRNILVDVVLVALSIIMVCNIYLANRTFLQLQIANMNVYSFYTTLVTRIQVSEDFDKSEKIALIGRADQYTYDLGDFKETGMPQVRAVGFNVNMYSREDYLKYFIGFDIEHASEDEITAIVNTTTFDEMPVYPYEGSIRRFGDIMVVKFSDPTLEAERDQLVEE